jgi:hypothetical protein
MFRRTADATAHRQPASSHSFPAPTRGWVTNENLAEARAKGAEVLDNWFPTARGLRLRGGAEKHATIPSAVISMFNYNAAGSEKLFACTASAVYDITTPADKDVSPSAAISGLSDGYFTSAHFATATANYMYITNASGSDNPWLYDGTTWDEITGTGSPAITGVTPSDLSSVWVYRNRLFFIEEGTMVAWYLPIESVGGLAKDINLAGVFENGGSLLFGQTWSLDAGDGADDKCLFVTTEGEVALYEGGDPSTADDWRLVGRYDVGHPLGRNAHMRVGGDLLIITDDGIVPMSQALNKDEDALRLSAITRPIEPDWVEIVEARGGNATTTHWEIEKWSEKGLAMITTPISIAGQTEQCFVVNLETGAWARYTGWDATCMALSAHQLYFGDNDGHINHAEAGGFDKDALYTAIYVGKFVPLSQVGRTKAAHLMRSTFLAGTAYNVDLSISTDYVVNLPAAPSAATPVNVSLWDTAKWDEDVWDSGGDAQVNTFWHTVHGAGFAFAPQVMITSGQLATPNVELVSLDLLYEDGAVVV